VTAAIVFFSIENRWRQGAARFFPAGDLSAWAACSLPVRARLLIVFLLTSVGPAGRCGIVALAPGPTRRRRSGQRRRGARRVLAIIAFFIVVGLVAAVRLSWVVLPTACLAAARPTFAMAGVERGDLDARCPLSP